MIVKTHKIKYDDILIPNFKYLLIKNKLDVWSNFNSSLSAINHSNFVFNGEGKKDLVIIKFNN